MDTLDTAANLAAVERAVAGVRWHQDDSPLEYIKAKGGKIMMFKVGLAADEYVDKYRCRMAVVWPDNRGAAQTYGDTVQDAVMVALIKLAIFHGWRSD
jgi:hypothetical protein